MNHVSRRRAFTVVELVVGIATIGVLIALVLPAGLGWESMTMNYPPNGPVVGSTIAACRCPADPGRKPVSHGSTPGSRSNYVGCFSPDGTMVELDHVRDGTANTIAAAETIAVDDEYRGNLAVWRASASIDGGENARTSRTRART